MSENVLDRLAQRLWKCPFDDAVFGSLEDLRSHLLDSHGTDISQTRLVPGTASLNEIERPTRLTFCGHCLGFVVPDAPDRNAISEIGQHVREKHPNPSGPAVLTLNVTKDPVLISRFMEEQVCDQVLACSAPNCGELFSSEDTVAAHWIEKHCFNATIEDARRLVGTDPERFGNTIEECLAEEFSERIGRLRSSSDSEDGYHISHSPSVPRVRSRPSETIVYIERERVRFSDEELTQLLESEGLDSDYEEDVEDLWTPGQRQETCLELRFSNIVDGYIPAVKSIRHILPPLADGAAIQVSWQDDPQACFPCKVSKTKRAIYNLEKRLKHIFREFPAGVRLYVTRLGVRRYHLHVNRQLHTVRDCKFFELIGENDWRVAVRDSEVEWETGDDVFRHHLTFDQMEALHREARRTNLSVRDAVYEAMSQIGRGEPIHVRSIYDAVFLRMRTCSLAAVWAQFRPEHQCYVKAAPGWYSFDPHRPLPVIRVRPIEVEQSIRPQQGHAPATKIRIRVRWTLMGRNEPDETIMTTDAGETQARFLAALIRVFGPSMAERFTREPVSRSYPLSSNPEIDFVNRARGTVYGHKWVPGTNLCLFTNTDNQAKCDDIRHLVQRLGFPPGSVEVSIVPWIHRDDFLTRYD